MWFVEAQTWWTPEGGHTNHIHVDGSDWPLYQQVTGPVAYNAKVKLHHVDGFVEQIDPAFMPSLRAGNYLQGEHESVLIEKALPFTGDSKASGKDGWQPWKVQATLRDADGTRRACRLIGSVDVRNGNPPNGKAPDSLTAHAWPVPSTTDGRGYTNATLAYASIPFAPVSGIWKPKVTVRSSNGEPRSLFVSVDPSFHAVPPYPGRVYVDAIFSKDPQIVVIDTRELSNGLHKLMIKGSDVGLFPGGTLEGVLVVGFEVRN
jgi:hypothetical protein